MKAIIYYYTGTGNSLWTARQLDTGFGIIGVPAFVFFLTKKFQ